LKKSMGVVHLSTDVLKPQKPAFIMHRSCLRTMAG